MTFLVDTGAQVSVIPPTHADRSKIQGLSLSAVNRTAIATFGTRSLTLNLGLCQTFHWIFIIANIQQPLLGADFLHLFGLLVDLLRRKLVDTHTHLHTPCTIARVSSPTPTFPTCPVTDEYTALLTKFPQLTRLHNYHDQPIQHNVTHHIITSDPQSPVVPAASPQSNCKLLAENLN